MSRIAGAAMFRVNGASFSTEGAFEVEIKGVKREPIASADGEVHFSEQVVPDTITGSILTTPDLNPQAISDMANVVVQVELKNGKTALLRNAFYTGDAKVTAMDGKMDVAFAGVGRWI